MAWVIALAKFLEGAWIVILLIPLLVLLFLGIRRHYQRAEQERASHLSIHPTDIHHRMIVPIAGLDQLAEQSLAYARPLSSHVTAAHIAFDEEEAETIRTAWEDRQQQVPEQEDVHWLAYIDTLHERHPDETLTVSLPELIVARWCENILHNQTALRLKASLLFHPGIVVVNVSHHLHHNEQRT